ncbi:hypothetical protein PNO24_01150 [Gemella haemolysans]|uniref:hypothetical protein n=1 Tax=Gemella haemolysans TaxID=1379 RepID=UPI00232C6EFD|nr:hypothetical protein [Gemella haemolysans]MDB6212535.1 hypothetical protein [Gemella haemolysans]
MNKRQAKKLELKNEISDIKKDYKLQDKKLEALNIRGDNFFEETKKLMEQFKKQEKLLEATKDSFSNLLQVQTHLELENSKRVNEMKDIIENQKERIHKLEYSVFGMAILMIIVFVLEVVKWLV